MGGRCCSPSSPSISFTSGWRMHVDEKEALVKAQQAVGFPVGHASAQQVWRGLRSRPTWRVLCYSVEEPPRAARPRARRRRRRPRRRAPRRGQPRALVGRPADSSDPGLTADGQSRCGLGRGGDPAQHGAGGQGLGAQRRQRGVVPVLGRGAARSPPRRRRRRRTSRARRRPRRRGRRARPTRPPSGAGSASPSASRWRRASDRNVTARSAGVEPLMRQSLPGSSPGARTRAVALRSVFDGKFRSADRQGRQAARRRPAAHRS